MDTWLISRDKFSNIQDQANLLKTLLISSYFQNQIKHNINFFSK